jgi:hypothetical protein
MATTSVSPSRSRSSSRLLRFALQADGIFEMLLGLAMLIEAGPLTTIFALSTPEFFGSGIVCVLYSVALFWFATRQMLSRPFALLTIMLNVVWVLGSIIAIATNLFPFTETTRWIEGGVALIVADLALLQIWGYLKR